ncbi:MAG: molecular chaperone HtpG [Rickettsia sp.]|nr:molecular chaperone HtpG [Rickettsia sp.]
MQETKNFSAEVDKVLNLVINSLYTNKDVAIRELISNASDACDKARYLLQTGKTKGNAEELKIDISLDPEKNQLIIRDTGIGMNKEDLNQNLGTIAKSGTQDFVQNLADAAKKDSSLIGQFGVGFYSAFMIADRVTVTSKKIDSNESWIWSSDGKGKYDIFENQDSSFSHGTEVKLLINSDQKKFLEGFQIKNMLKNYSDHILFPIFLHDKESKGEQINSMSALWMKSKSEITEKEYSDFYKKISHDFQDPALFVHFKSEGTISFTTILFIPASNFQGISNDFDTKSKIRLFIKRVFISEDLDILPGYLSFVRGIVDSEDLPLNISRETLQHNAQISKIKTALTKKILSELKSLKNSNIEKYKTFWNNFGNILKIGLAEPNVNTEEKNKILEIAFFNSALKKSLISLDEYINDIKTKGAKTIYYLTGNFLEEMYHNAQIEGFLENEIDVLLLTDPIDPQWIMNTNKYKDVEIKSVSRSNLNLDNLQDDKQEENSKNSEEKKTEYPELIDKFKEILKDSVSEVKISKKLTTSPACLSLDDNSYFDIKLETMLVSHGKLNKVSAKALEINPKSEIIKKVNNYIIEDAKKYEEKIAQIVNLVYDQSCIIAGLPIKDPNIFVKRLNNALQYL